ncbi:unnamed protein product [Auanema sp. JU1783]|nr:unnamed protein product [Auanema sp. JU1783]
MCCCLFRCCCSTGDTTYQDIVLNKGYRTCTDSYFLFFFFLFCCGLGTTTWYAFEHGDPYRIVYGSDSFGNTCGRLNKPVYLIGNESDEAAVFPLSGRDMRKRKFMFPLNITRPLDTMWVCARECPKSLILNRQALRAVAQNNDNPLCVPHVFNGTIDLLNGDVCPKLPVTKSVSILNRCIPEDILTISEDLINKFIELDFVRGYLSDALISSHLVFKMCGVAFAFSFIMVYILRCVASIVIYFVYLSVLFIFTGITSALWYSTYLTYHSSPIAESTIDLSSTPSPEVQLGVLFRGNASNFKDLFKFDYDSRLTVLGLSIGSTVITGFIVMTVWCLLPRGQKMVVLFKKASKALWAMPCLLFQPIVSAFAVLTVALYSLSVILVLLTSGALVSRVVDDGHGANITIIENNMTETTRAMILYQAVGFIWLCEFVLACQRLFIAGAVSMWYFNSKRNQPGENRTIVCSSLWNLFRYHLGSAAVGSFIITIVRIPRYILMWIYAKMRNVENLVLRRLLACCIFLLACIERCLDYINYNAFTVIAYSGMSFCPAAKVAVNILFDNAIDVATINSVGGAVLFLAKCMVAAGTSALAIFTMEMSTLSHPWFPILLIFICSYLIANCFFSVYEMTIDSLFLCCAEDFELTRENPDNKYSNEEFREIIAVPPMENDTHKVRQAHQENYSMSEVEHMDNERF